MAIELMASEEYVDAAIAAVQTFKKLVVDSLPSAEAADDKTIYLVPRTGSETPDLCDEYVVVGETGSRRWERIGGIGIAQHQQLTPVYSQTPTFSEWTFSGDSAGAGRHWEVYWSVDDGYIWVLTSVSDSDPEARDDDSSADSDAGLLATTVHFTENSDVIATRTRTDVIGYTLGDQATKPLQPQGDYAPATNIPKAALASDVQTSLGKADTALQQKDVSGKENANNKVTSISSSSTDLQYPSAKCVWDIVGDVESALAAINGTANGGSGT